MQQQHHSRAPITEAVIDIEAQLPSEVKLDVLAQGLTQILHHYQQAFKNRVS